jgi:hypothetical protein
MTKSIKLLCLLTITGQLDARAQGCSDAGACSAGPIGQLQLWQDSTSDVVDYRHMARVGYTYAIGEQGTTIIQTNAELSVGIGPRLSVQAKVPYIWAGGNLSENRGIGDIITTASYAFVKESDRNLTTVLGVRLPTGSTDAMNTTITTSAGIGRPLPMPYQTGLGTTDLLMGINARHGRWVAAFAYQHVLHNANNNRFTHGSWFHDEQANEYFESNFLERKDDLVGRLQYAYGCGRLSLQPGLLAIYHVAEDTRQNDFLTDMNSPPERVAIAGSQGLTLNVTLDVRFKLSEQWAIETSLGAPVVTREARPDGLTRDFVGSAWLRYRF